MFCRSLFVFLYFFFWPLCCLFFFNIWILIAPLVSSNSSYKYSLKIPKGYSETVNRGRTDNTIPKWKEQKGQTLIYKTPHRKPKNGLYNPAANRDVRICSGRIYTLYAGVAGMLLECILMKSYQWENLFCRKASFITVPNCQFLCVSRGMKHL